MAYKRSRKDFEADLQKHESPHVAYGTPLPPLDDHMRDDGSYVPVWKQEVTDDRGRKRLHGAFTGGFSAGYFNTVGSKEGWSPSTFVSSRTNRAKDARNQAQQRPEDFMDEEDIREQEESRHLSTVEGFAGFGTVDDETRKNTFMDLFRPAEDTMGMKLLNKMGWKQGHGIGPKVRRRLDAESPSGEAHLFAPEDVPMLSFLKKTDYGGLGASSANGGASSASERQVNLPTRKQSEIQSEDEDSVRPGLSFASRNKKPSKPKRGAFGTGVLNDTGSDDEDTYSMGPSIAYNRTLGGDKKSKKNRLRTEGNANPMLKNKPVFVPKRLNIMSNALRKCHDGRLPLDGFVLADELDKMSTMSLNDEKYRPPAVPEGWKPSRAPDGESAAQDEKYKSTAETARSSTHTSSTRGNLLGESALPGKSVFDFLTPAAREKLMKASGKTDLPPALSESLPGAAHESLTSQIPPLDPQTALLALSRTLNGGFTPYPNDPSKAARYKSYLESQANVDNNTTNTPPAPKPPTMTQEDHLTELHEFARTAEVFKPMSGAIASRFTTSSTSQPGTDPSAAENLLTNPSTRPKDPSEEAAAMGMFGPLTRSVSSFHPTRLLCKRFGVAVPNPAELPQGSYDAGGATSRFQSAEFQPPEDNKAGNAVNVHKQAGTEGSSQNQQLAIEAPTVETSMTSTVKVDPDTNDALEQERPGAAVFRAIFGNSDDEDDD